MPHSSGHRAGRLASTLAAVAVLAACAAPSGTPPIAQAATAPLSDVNLVQAPIPDVLAAAQKKPYAMPADASCPALARDVRALDEVLGADLDTPPTETNPSLIERGVDFANDEVVGGVRRAAESVVPYRRWVRKLTGAERYSRQVSAAIAAGTARRAFLKGAMQAKGCTA